MVSANRNLPLVASFGVVLNNRTLGKDVTAWMLNVVIEDDVDLPGMFSIDLISRQDEHGTVPWTDDARLALGTSITLSMGYGDRLDPLLVGEITALEPVFHIGGPPTLLVRGYDKRHRLNTVRRTRSFVDHKDSDIVSNVCQALRIKAQATDSNVTHPYVLQSDQTDLEFLLERARRSQFQLSMQGETLMYGPVGNAGTDIATLTLEDDLLDFQPRLSLVPVTQLEAHGWDHKEKATFTASASSAKDARKMGDKSAADTAAGFVGASVQTLLRSPIVSRAEADQLVQGRFDAAALDYITGFGTCRGRTDIRAGKVIRIEQVGKRFSGPYYVTSAIHSYTKRHGYITTFRVRRNASS
jgi:phage protein D